jgi:hypothetical protein
MHYIEGGASKADSLATSLSRDDTRLTQKGEQLTNQAPPSIESLINAAVSAIGNNKMGITLGTLGIVCAAVFPPGILAVAVAQTLHSAGYSIIDLHSNFKAAAETDVRFKQHEIELDALVAALKNYSITLVAMPMDSSAKTMAALQINPKTVIAELKKELLEPTTEHKETIASPPDITPEAPSEPGTLHRSNP